MTVASGGPLPGHPPVHHSLGLNCEVTGLSNHYELHITRENGMDRMLVKVEAAEPDASRPALATTLEEHLRTHIGVRLETDVVEPGTLPPHQLKTKRIFDQRPVEERPSFDLGRQSR